MGKNFFKRFLAVAFALLVLCAQIDMPVSAFTGANEVTEESGANQDESAVNDETAVSEDNAAAESAAPADNAGASVSATLASGMLKAGESPFATFDGQDLATNPSFSFSPKDIASSARTLTISETFPDNVNVSGAKIEIKVNNVLRLAGGAGLVKDNNNGWVFDKRELADQLEGSISNVTYTPEKVNGVLTGKATIVYYINPGTPSVIFDLQLELNPTYSVRMNGGGSESFNDTVEVRASYTESGVEKEKNTTKISNVTITNSESIWIGFEQSGSQFKNQGDSGTITIGLPLYVNAYNFNGGAQTGAIQELIYNVKINKHIGLTGVRINNGSVSYTIIADPSDADYDIMTITASNFSTTGRLYFDYTLPSNIPAGDYPVFVVPTTISGYTNSITRIDGISHTGGIYSQGEKNVISVTDPNVVMNLEVNANNHSIALKDENTSMNLLGHMNIGNTSANPITNQSAKLDFSNFNSVYGVEQVTLKTPTEATVTNIKVKTNLGNTYTITSVPDAVLTGNNKYATVSKQLLGITNANEFISELTWDYAGKFPGGWNTGVQLKDISYFKEAAVRYYGKILAMPTDRKYDATLKVFETGNITNIFTDKTQTIYVSKESDGYSATMGLYGTTLDASKKSGDKHTVTLATGYSNYRYTANMLRTLKGIAFYVRNTEYATIDLSTLEVSWNGNTYKTSDNSLTVIEGVDSTNNKFFKLELPDVTLGVGNPDDISSNFPEATITYQFKIKPSAPTTAISTQDFVMVTPLDSNIPFSNGGSYYTYLTADKYNVTGKANPAYNLVSVSSGKSFKIEAQKSFLVTTAANLDDGPWVSYDFDTEQTIIDLNPEGDAKYQLTVTNNSGQTINGYTALVPIPKYGEQTALTSGTDPFESGYHLQKEAFGWTTSLLEEINTSAAKLNYQVLYATTYETERNSPKFVAWDVIANKDDIRMVKIFTTDAIVDGTVDVIDFPLALTDPLADAHAGNMNIYSARIFRSIDGNDSYKASEPIAIRLKTGIVTGVVFDDMNRNGIQDAGEAGRNGVSVIAYEAGTLTKLASTTTQTINGVDGQYKFMGLDKNQNVDIIFTNPNVDDSTRFSPVTSGGSTPTAAADKLSAITSNITPSTIIATTINAGLITPTVVTFNAQGGSTAETTVKRYPGEKITTKPDATKTGYTFNDWFPTATGGTAVTFPYTVGTTDTTLYAQYTANQYTLSFDIAANGGEGTAPAAQVVTYGNKAAEPATPVKTGYSFSGWYDAAVDGNKWNFNTTTMPAGDTTLYAQFVVNSYTVTFDNEGATTTASVTYNTAITEPVAPVKTGYTFDGWYTASSGGTKWNFTTGVMPANDMTLYAQYIINSYLVTYDNQGSITTELLPYNSLLTEPAAPSKSGYTFVGWFDAVTGGTQWNFATDRLAAANMTLYARFSADDQTITFDVNGGNAASKPADLIQPTDSAVNLDAVAVPTKDGYTFIGWFDAGDVPYSGTIPMPVGGLNLFAHWTAADQVIRFNTNGGTGVPSITAATDTTVDLDTVSTTRDGYTFDGWYVGTTQYSGVITVPAGGLTLDAHWIALDQTITFDTDGAGTIASITAPTDSPVDLSTIAAPSKFAYKFLGWFDASGAEYSGTIAMPAGGLQLQAHWQDLIATGVWSIKANNIEFSMSELNQFINAGTLEQEILTRSHAVAWDADQNTELNPLTADTSVLLANAVVGDHLVTIEYPDPAASSMTLAATNEEQQLATTITVSVTDDTTPVLPITGQNLLTGGIAGGVMTIVALIMLIVNKRRAKK